MGFPEPDSSCQSQFINSLGLSFASSLISQRTHAESDLAPDRLPEESPVERRQGLPTEGRLEILGLIEDYRQGLVPLIVPLTLLKHHLNRYPVPDWVPVPSEASGTPAGLSPSVPGADAAEPRVGQSFVESLLPLPSQSHTSLACQGCRCGRGASWTFHRKTKAPRMTNGPTNSAARSPAHQAHPSTGSGCRRQEQFLRRGS
jgi:hypothetical protein